MAISVRNLQRKQRFDCDALQQFAERALAKIPRKHSLGEIDVLLVSDRRMAILHRRFMKITGSTDVITFQHGEIFVSVETAKRNAQRFHTSTIDEVKLYVVHGLLHLHGYNDRSAAGARVMARVQFRLVKAASRP